MRQKLKSNGWYNIPDVLDKSKGTSSAAIISGWVEAGGQLLPGYEDGKALDEQLGVTTCSMD